MTDFEIELEVNGEKISASVEPRLTLVDFLRVNLNMTGTHVGCEHGVCGSCTVLVNGDAVRACLMLAVQANCTKIRTVEGLAAKDGTLHKVQQVMHEEHGLQCGFCTPGIVMTLVALTENGPKSEEEMRAAMSGHVCRCTGYQGILRSVSRLANEISEAGETS